MEGDARKRWGVAFCVGLVALAFVFLPIPWPCPLRLATGIPCPGCGMTRAVRLLAKGDLVGACKMHPLVVATPLLGALWLADVRSYLRTGKWGLVFARARTSRLLGVFVVISLVVWIARFAGAFGGPVAP